MIGKYCVASLSFVAASAFLAASSFGAFEPPAGYYNAATGTGTTLKGQLKTIMTNGHIQRNYGNLRDSSAITDADPNHPGNILLVYNRASVSAAWDGGVTWNREHVWPVSLQGGSEPSNTTTGHRADAHALRPANPSINSSRGNKPFGHDRTTGNHGAVSSGYYFPGDADKGDIARQLFYSDTRWSDLGLSLTDAAPGSFQMGDLSSLIAWHYLDPPDEFERRRNHAIYSQAMNPSYYQNNRNAFVDRPEFVWSIYMNQSNDSQIAIAGAAVNADGSSVRNVDLGRVLVGGNVPAAQAFTINKAGTAGTYYEVTTSGAATSTVADRFNSFAMGGSGTKAISVGLNTSTATAGLKNGAVTVNNLDVTTMAGAGRGANDGNDTFNVSLSVLDHAIPSFAGGANQPSLTLGFGSVTMGSTPPPIEFELFNRVGLAGFTADLDFDSVTSSGASGVLTTNLAASAGNLSIDAGNSHSFSAFLNAATPGDFSATFTLHLSDENLPGALPFTLTLMLEGEVTSAQLFGDFNADGAVDLADYIVWRAGNGTVYNDTHYELWKSNFGNTSAAAMFASRMTQVPEPSTGVFVVGIELLMLRRKR